MSTRIARTLPVGATINVGGTIWTKYREKQWINDWWEVINDVTMDQHLAWGAGEVVRVTVGLETEPVPAYDVDEGEYVVLSFGVFYDGAEYLLNPDERVAQQLWRVVGFTEHSTHDSTLLIDAPEKQLKDVATYRWGDEAGPEIEPVQVLVGADSVLHVVKPGQDHERWDDTYCWDEYETWTQTVGPRN